MKTLLMTLIIGLGFAQNSMASILNLTGSPFLSTAGIQNLELSYKVFEHWTFGLVGTSSSGHFKKSDIELSGNSYGGVIRYYIDTAFENDSWFVSGSATKSNYEASITSGGTQYTGKAEDWATAGAGYHWFWKSFNFNFGAVISNQAKIQVKDALGNKYKDEFDPSFGLEINIGGKF